MTPQLTRFTTGNHFRGEPGARTWHLSFPRYLQVGSSLLPLWV